MGEMRRLCYVASQTALSAFVVTRSARGFMKRLILAFAAFAFAVLAVFALPHPGYRLVCQKIATESVMPYSLVAMGLLAALIAVWRDQRKWLRWLVGGLLLLHYGGGNGVISQYLLLTLEEPFQTQRTYELEPFDAIVVLGGGTDEARNGYAESSLAGDRIVVAARVYHAGLTPRIICTGDRFDTLGVDAMSPANEAEEILIGLGIPKEHIERVGGQTTSAEMVNLTKVIQPNQRVGLVTSAWHLGRAMKLSKTQGLDFTPIPADFRTDRPININALELLPDADDSADIRIVIKEYLAQFLGR